MYNNAIHYSIQSTERLKGMFLFLMTMIICHRIHSSLVSYFTGSEQIEKLFCFITTHYITKNKRPNTDVFVKVSTTVCLFSEVTDVVKFFHSASINHKLITIYFPRMTTRNDNIKTRFLSVMDKYKYSDMLICILFAILVSISF